MIIAPSVLSLDYSDTKKQLDELNASGAEWMHYDVMDGNMYQTYPLDRIFLKHSAKLLHYTKMYI